MAALTSARAIPSNPLSRVGRWFTTTNHKDIGLLYILLSVVFLVLGGLEAMFLRVQLAQSGLKVLSPETYNQIFTMHGTTMVFLFGMPILAGVGNYMVPLQIGARDMAFPRLNALGLWLFLAAGILLYSSFPLGGAPNAGWFAYAPMTEVQFSPTHGMDFWALGMVLSGLSSTIGAINFIVTIINLRAPTMSFFKMPLFTWQVLVTSFLIIFAMPTLTVDAIFLFIARNFGAPFFLANEGGDPILWQHLFWFFGHPEVYILILPAFGIISEVIPVFSRKPIFGYNVIVFSGIAIGFLGFTVWAHHMFAVGLNPIADAIFSIESMIIAVPTSVKIFNWIATMWGGKINFKVSMLFATGFVAMFLIGGLSGISLAIVPIDFQVSDSYYVVAHFHYVLMGGTVFGVFAGLYYWFPKVTGRLLSETLGKWHFWTMFAGFNLTFFPMHIVGLLGMPRRIYTYGGGMGWDTLNLLATVGAFVLAISVALLLINLVWGLRRGQPAGNDPWDAQTLEWTVSSPPPVYNFATIPVVASRRPFWDQKHFGGPAVAPETVDPAVAAAIHLPGGSIYPLLVTTGLLVAAYAMVYLAWFGVGLGVLVTLASIIGWARQPR
jgi:cytochrome c oxidase subunit I